MAVALLLSCGHSSNFTPVSGESAVVPDSLAVDTLLRVTPVRDQGRSDLCWIYAMLAAVETDRLEMGDSVCLSPLWVARHTLIEQAREAYLAHRPVSLKGTLPEAMRLMQTYGIVSWDSYHTDTAPTSRVARTVQEMAHSLAQRQRGLQALDSDIADMLDEQLGPAPRYVFMLGAEYTPVEFTHSVCLPGDWQAYTSFTHHPFGSQFAVEIPDNTQRHEAHNIPLSELLDLVVSSVRAGHPVAWEGCMTHFDSARGSGRSAQTDLNAIQRERQSLFERGRMTDDHCMTIVGTAHRRHHDNAGDITDNASGATDKTDDLYFICKNSWGTNDGHNGYRYMSARQLLLSTILVMVKTGS